MAVTNFQLGLSESDQIKQELAALGIPAGDINNPAPDWAITFAQDMIDAGYSGDYFGSPLGGGFKLPSGLSVGEFSMVEGWAHQMAANSNWKYMPTASMIWDAYNAGYTNQSQATAFWFGKLPQTAMQAAPWLKYGMTADSYQRAWSDVSGVSLELAGQKDPAQVLGGGVFDAILSHPGQYSQDQIRDLMRSTLASTGQGWYGQQYGYTYSSWQQFKRDHRSDVISRFGAQAATDDQSYFQLVSNPVTSGVQSHSSGQQEYTRDPKSNLNNYSQSFVR